MEHQRFWQKPVNPIPIIKSPVSDQLLNLVDRIQETKPQLNSLSLGHTKCLSYKAYYSIR